MTLSLCLVFVAGCGHKNVNNKIMAIITKFPFSLFVTGRDGSLDKCNSKPQILILTDFSAIKFQANNYYRIVHANALLLIPANFTDPVCMTPIPTENRIVCKNIIVFVRHWHCTEENALLNFTL